MKNKLNFTLIIFLVLVILSCNYLNPKEEPLNSTGNKTDSTSIESVKINLDNPIDSNIVEASENILGNIYEKILPSVVQIKVRSKSDNPNNFIFPFATSPQSPEQILRGEGSGFVWDESGHIITNHHLVDDPELFKVNVIFSDGAQYNAEVVGSDPHSDLAVLKIITEEKKLIPALMGTSSLVKVGQFSAAIGNPFGQEFTFTSGIISATGRTIQGLGQFSIPQVLQTDAAINPGNSGGPLLNRKGEVIGINTQIVSRDGGNSGVGFAVPIDIAKRVIPELIQNGYFEYSFLGIAGATINPDIATALELPKTFRGVLVAEILPGGPAEKAGLIGSSEIKNIDGESIPIGGDIITHVNDVRVKSMSDLIIYLDNETRPGEKTNLTLFNIDSEPTQLVVTLGTRPTNP
ncbi:MAG: trypsin [Chloroflexi bacterium]|nr:trypsin [Chloroflexota bacterium]|tara:strand:+ start:8351 stop:9568 length:1218 start_codon:yes stop_codon:yes gene_type:complete